MHKIFIFIALAFFLSNIITHVDGVDSDIVQNVADLSEITSTSTDIKTAQTYSNKFNELELKLERRLEENVKTHLPQQLLQMDNMLTKINENVKNQLDGQFIQQILEEARLIFVYAQSNLQLIVSKLRILTSDPVIKGDVIIYAELLKTKQTTKALLQTTNSQFYIINTYYGERANLLKNLERAEMQRGCRIGPVNGTVECPTINNNNSRSFCFLIECKTNNTLYPVFNRIGCTNASVRGDCTEKVKAGPDMGGFAMEGWACQCQTEPTGVEEPSNARAPHNVCSVNVTAKKNGGGRLSVDISTVLAAALVLLPHSEVIGAARSKKVRANEREGMRRLWTKSSIKNIY